MVAYCCVLCTESSNQESYNCTSGGPSSVPCDVGGEKYLAVFIIAQIIHGFGFTPMFTLGTAYIDENEDHQLAAVYIGKVCFLIFKN